MGVTTGEPMATVVGGPGEHRDRPHLWGRQLAASGLRTGDGAALFFMTADLRRTGIVGIVAKRWRSIVDAFSFQKTTTRWLMSLSCVIRQFPFTHACRDVWHHLHFFMFLSSPTDHVVAFLMDEGSMACKFLGVASFHVSSCTMCA